MGLITPQEIEVKNIMIDVLDLPYRSQRLVKIVCDYCGEEDFIMYRDAYRQIQSIVCTKICCTKPECKKAKATEVRRINADAKYDFKSTQYRDKDWLYNEYIILDKSAELISEETGLGLRTVRRYINEFELVLKNGSKTNFITKEELEELYINQRKTTAEIGKIYNLCDGTIGELLKKYNIEIFSQSEQMLRYYYEKGGIEKTVAYYNLMENKIKASCQARKIDIKDFDGFISSENSRQRNSYKYFDRRNKVFEKDDYTCQCCGQRGGKLQVHHIKNFSTNEELRFNVDNGVVLCYDCHSPCASNSFHSLYGKKNNNAEQLKEYIETRKSEVA